MKKHLVKILGLFLLTVILFALFGHRVQEGHSANCPVLHISSDRIQPSNSKRSQIYLNGVWQFIPSQPSDARNVSNSNSSKATRSALPFGNAKGERSSASLSQPPPPDASWGSILVPGDWQAENDDSTPGVIKRGTGKAWDNFNGSQLAKAWYQRKIKIPQDWKGRSILLDIRRVSTDAIVYVNGIECSEINWPYGAVDITRSVKPGEDATISILVAAAADEAEKTVIMGPNEMYKTEAKLASRGLVGEVRLLSLPQGTHISDVFVKPSTRKQQIELEVELQGVRQAGLVRFSAEMLDEKGKVEREFTATANAKAAPTQVLKMVWNWPNPRLWDVNQPNLYTLRLKGQGNGIDDEYDQQFGFREFWIEGRNFYLNGKAIRLRPTVFDDTWQGWSLGIPEVIDRVINGYLWAGFNITQIWPWDHDERGRRHFQELFADRADLKGYPLMAPTLNVAGISSNEKWNSERQRWEERMAIDLRRYRNHPSILLWTSSPNFFGHSDDQNPRRIGKKKIEGKLNQVEDKRMAEIVPIGEEAVGVIKKYDPTRPVMMHQGATVGDVYALNSYLNLIPLQEREEWLSQWSQQGDMPYMVVEFGTPLHATMMRGRNGFSPAVVSEPLMTEFTAIYLGKRAYELETPQYRAKIRESFVKDQEYQNWFGKSELNYAPTFQAVQQLFSTNTWRSWRTYGMTGGMIPWNNGHGWEGSPEGEKEVDLKSSPEGRGVYLKQAPKSLWYSYQPEANIIHPSGRAILQNNGPTLAWIAGSRQAFTAKDHSFTTGQRLEKQVVLINDTRSGQEFSFDWQVLLNGQAIAKEQKIGKIETAQTLFFPIAVDLPKDIEGKKVTGEIRLSARIGNRQHEDRFAFRIFPQPSKATGTITVFDPVGKTTQMLKQLGYAVVPWDGSQTPSLLAIGREALSGDRKLPGNLETFIRNGGRAIAFTQNPEWIQRLGFRVAPHLTRRVFPVDATHPVVQGLDELDLRDWTGESTLVAAYPNTLDGNYKRSPHTNAPWHGWHWSNRGAVSSASVEKPHRSSWRSLLESEFDLAYTPLMELDYGKGRLIWNTLDLEDHVLLDAAARQLAQQIIDYAAKAPLSPKANKVILIGNEADKAKLDALGLIYQQSNSLVTDAELTIIGAGANIEDKELQAYLNRGGKLFFLPRRSPSSALGVRLHQVKNFPSLPSLPKWLEVRGISASDLRSRTEYDTWAIESGGEIASSGLLSRITLGKGVAIFCQIDPDGLNANEKTYLRYTRWRQTHSVAQLLANLGASFKTDAVLFNSPPTKSFFSKQPAPPASLYHSDYRDDFELGDDPYRYYRW